MSKKTPKPGGVVQGNPEKVCCDLDPNLQEVILSVANDEKLDPAFAEALPDGTVQVDVLAKLDDPTGPVYGLNVVRRIGQIVTGTVNVTDIEKVRKDPNVISLKRATRVHKQLDYSVAEINASQDHLHSNLSGSAMPIDGRGVIVGIVDYGCDFNHHNFRNPDGTTRILFLWDQRGGQSATSPIGFNYGREFDATAINAAFASSSPYLKLGYNPGKGSHGTHVMDIAAGNGRGTGRPGVAPAADLIFVQVEPSDVNDEESFGNSRILLEAVDYIFSKAAALNRPAVVNISLGTHGGPHDGTTLAEQGFDSLLQTPGRAICISAGNSWERGAHATGVISQGVKRTLRWIIQPNDLSRNELEVWYSGNAVCEVSIITPSGMKLNPIVLGTTVSLKNTAGSVIGRVFHRATDPNNGDNQIDVFLEPSAPAGEWGIELSTAGAQPLEFHAWIERDDPSQGNPAAQSRFADADVARTYSIGSVSCGRRTIAVGSYLSSDQDISPFSSEGPTRDGRKKPEISAPGQWLNPYWTWGIQAAMSGTQATTRMSGTSMASPHIAGVVALMMQAAPNPLSAEDLTKALVASARRADSAITWDGRFGFGRVDALAAIQSVAPALANAASPAPHAAATGSAAGKAYDVSLQNVLAAVVETTRNTKTKLRFAIEVESHCG